MIKKSKNIKDIRIQAGRPLVLDGATGTQLIERGVEQDNSLWTSLANLNSPDIVQKVHEDYIYAGADIITTNTFRTNPAATEKYGKVFSEKMVEAALQIAFDAAAGRETIIAGCNPPAEDCYQQERKLSENELKDNHQEHITLLWEYGSDIILNETQSHLDEILIICKICSSMQIPFIISMLIDENLKLLSGEYVNEVFSKIKKFNPAAIGINCVDPAIYKKFTEHVNIPDNFGFYLNMGLCSHHLGVISGTITPDDFVDAVKPFISDKILFVGGCCGSGPAHIKKLRKHIDSLYRN